MKCKFIVFNVLFFLSGQMFAQINNEIQEISNNQFPNFEFCAPKASLIEVSFFDNHSFFEDPEIIDNSISVLEYELPHWLDENEDGDVLDENDRKYPICYTKNNKIKISSIFNVENISDNMDVKIRATTSIGITFPTVNAFFFNDGDIGYGWEEDDISPFSAPVSSVNSLVDEVQLYDEFTVTWEVSTDGGTTWKNSGESTNTLYVVHGNPTLISNSLNTLLFHTTLDLACRNVVGETDSDAIVEKMYEEFTDRCVTKVEDLSEKCMTYYDPVNPAPPSLCFATYGLLATGDGRCGAWASLFFDMINAHGIETATRSGIQVNPLAAIPDDINTIFETSVFDEFGFLPNQIETEDVEVGAGEMKPYAYIFINNWNIVSPIPTFTVSDEDGIVAQGVSETLGGIEIIKNPASIFPNHRVVKYENKYFDPSYGSEVFGDGDLEDAKKLWEDNGYAGYGIVWNKIGETLKRYWIVEINSETVDLIFDLN